jgi:hypothetical protein
MHQRRSCYLLLSVFLFSLALPMVSSSPSSIQENANVDSIESNWQSIEPHSTQAISLKEIDSTIELAGLSFDPIHTDLTHLSAVWKSLNSNSLYLVQLSVNDGSVMDRLESNFEIHVLERQSSAVYVVRMHDATQLSSIASDSDVRWIGAYEPFMRTTNDVLGAQLVQVALSVDIEPSNVPVVSAFLVQHGASTAWCSVDMCEAVYEFGINSAQLRYVASHEHVLFVQRAYDLSLHNNLAATEVGAVAVRASSSLGLDGSGETIAVMDTELTMIILTSLVVSPQSTHNTVSTHHQLTATAVMGRM